MAADDHLDLLRKGVETWNQWRLDNQVTTMPFLAGADLSCTDLATADLSGANLHGANLNRSNLSRSNLHAAELGSASMVGTDLEGAFLRAVNAPGAVLDGANLKEANLSEATLYGASLIGTDLGKADLLEVRLAGADLSGATLCSARLRGASLFRARLTGADLAGANLTKAHLVETTIDDAILTGAQVYGVAAWNLYGATEHQKDMVISAEGEATLTTDELEIAQFVYLMTHNKKLRQAIDAITSKVVLILGRFSPDRKIVLDALRKELRSRNLVPVLFDFDVPANLDITETVTLLARMARFVVADLTAPASIPLELQAIAPHVTVPIRTIVHEDQKPFSMLGDLTRKYHWVLEPYEYGGLGDLLTNLDGQVIAPAEEKRRELGST